MGMQEDDLAAYEAAELATQPQTNGNSPPPANAGKRAGLKDIMVGSENTQYWDLSQELLKAPGNFADLLPRSRMDKKEIAAMLRIMATTEQYAKGSISIPNTLFFKAAALIGLDGEARQEAIRARGTGGFMNQMGGMVGNFVDRFRSNGVAGREGPQ